MSIAIRLALSLLLLAPAWSHQDAQEPLALETQGRTQDLTGDPRVRWSAQLEPERPFAGERLGVRMRLELDDAFLSDAMLQPFRRLLDVPVQIEADWLADAGEAEGPRVLEVKGLMSARIALGDREVRAHMDGSIPDEWRVELMVQLPSRSPGPTRIAGPSLRIAYASEFRDDFLQGRVANNRIDAIVRSEDLEVEVRALPEVDVPIEFTGAVGAFTLSAELERDAVALGETVRLRVTVRREETDWRGSDVEALELPRFELPEVSVLGRTVETDASGRTFVHELRFTGEPGRRLLPALAFVAFDPRTERFERSETEPLAVEVLPRRDRPAAPADEVERTRPSPATAAAPESESPGLGWLVGIGLAVLVVAGIALRARLSSGR